MLIMIIREHIYEKFQKDSDPIKDLGIGVISIWKSTIQEIRNGTIGTLPDIFNKLFSPFIKNKKFYVDYSIEQIDLVRIIIFTLEELLKNPEANHKEVLKKVCDLELEEEFNLMKKNKINVKQILKDAKNILEKKYYLNLSEKEINENFVDEQLINSLLNTLNESLNEGINLTAVYNTVKSLKNKTKTLYSLIEKFNKTNNKKIKNIIAVVISVILLIGYPAINIDSSDKLNKEKVKKISSLIGSKNNINADYLRKISDIKFPNLSVEIPENIKANAINVEVAKISNAAKELIKDHEKLKLEAYTIGDGMVTIGWGHAEPEKISKYKKGDQITEKQANTLFEKDIKNIENGVRYIFKQWKEDGRNVMITQSMFDSMVSLGYNMGITNLRTSQFIQQLKKLDYIGAAEKIKTTRTTARVKDKSGNVKHVEMPGLIDRRKAEHELFIKDLKPVNK